MARERRLPPLITPEVVRQILSGNDRVSLDLGLTVESIVIGDGGATFPGGTRISFLELRNVEERENVVFSLQGQRLEMVAISDRHFYKLVQTEGAPTLEVDGVRMHRTKGTTPDVDAHRKVKSLGIRRGRVLDTCTGLGYTAQAAIERGADLVITVELKPQVLKIARINPWSRDMFEEKEIHILLGDSFQILDSLPRGFFDYVIHDPPRFALAGQLYSLNFYSKLFRVLGDGGRLFHYTGEPGSRFRGVDIRRGVTRRLREAGFAKIVYQDGILGVTCQKGGR